MASRKRAPAAAPAAAAGVDSDSPPPSPNSRKFGGGLQPVGSTRKVEMEEPEIDGGELVGTRPTSAAHCEVHREGLDCGITRKINMFTIEAFNDQGARQLIGGDSFFVAIRGRGEKVRAKVIDHEDGTYSVGYKPTVSGRYTISLSIHGAPLKDSPFTTFVSTPTPSAPHCVLRGIALTAATARKEEHFEVQFRDATGQIAHAEDVSPSQKTDDEDYALPALTSHPCYPSTVLPPTLLPPTLLPPTLLPPTAQLDVYVEAISPSSLDAVDQESSPADSSEQAREQAPQRAEDRQRCRGSSESVEGAGGQQQQPAAGDGGTGGGAHPTVQPVSSVSSSPPSSRPSGAQGFVPLLKTHECMVTSKKPLVVRATSHIDSPKLGHLQPGQKVGAACLTHGVCHSPCILCTLQLRCTHRALHWLCVCVLCVTCYAGDATRGVPRRR